MGFNIGDLPSEPVRRSRTRHSPVHSALASVGEQPVLVEPSKDLLLTFDSGSAEMTPQDKSNAEEFAEALQDPKLGGYRFRIEGYTDNSGPRAFNVTLSQQRADSARDYLVSIGVDPSRIDSKGFGPVLIRKDAPLDRANRRVIARRIE
jgi:OmpA-OmpF porin, OOP family